jgi:bifunctional UDP-N-acetylglucosamine pyrophosphorylase / glucosamine-1-phosphate N-acetyltransferase
MYFLNTYNLHDDLQAIDDSNAAHELYLTDVISSRKALAYIVEDFHEILGINTRYELTQMEAIVQERLTRRFMEDGVSFVRPETSYIEIGVTIAPDTMVLPGTYLMGKTAVGSGCTLGPNCVIADCDISDGCTVTFSQMHNAKVGSGVKIGPYANIRPDTVLADNVKIGNFVETKKTIVAKGSKIPHLSYVGDSEVGEGVNIGAGTITCNYDGFEKHKTTIEDNVFIGSNSTIVAPRVLKKGSYVAAGSVITEDVPVNDLAIGRGRQVNKPGSAERLRQQLKRKAEQAASVEAKSELDNVNVEEAQRGS